MNQTAASENPSRPNTKSPMLLQKRLPAEFSRREVVVTTTSYRRYWTHSLGAIHQDLLAAVALWVPPGAVVWDIGANVGIFTIAAALKAGRGGKVYAFEADVEMAALIARSLDRRLSNEADVCLCPGAVSDHDGEVQFVISGYRTAASAMQGFGRFAPREADRVRSVATRTLDSYLPFLAKPALVKIDVEGAENLVLEGARELVASCRPVILIEASGGQSGLETAEILRSMNYVWRGWTDHGAWSSAAFELAGDLVALPADHPMVAAQP